MKKIILSLFVFVSSTLAFAQDTIIVQTFTYDSNSRNAVFQFPHDSISFGKIIMEYSMRCKDGIVNTSGGNNIGCGEWDYSCNTYIVDSSKIDSQKATHKNYIINDFNGNTFPYTTQNTFNYIQYTQKNVTYDSILNETNFSVGSGNIPSTQIFPTSQKTVKSQFLFSATELQTSGIATGNLNGIKIDVSNAGSSIEHLTIRMKNTNLTALDTISKLESNLTEVYYKNTSFVNGLNHLKFYNPFVWDGTSNILIEFSYTLKSNGTDNEILCSVAPPNNAVISNDEDYYISFHGTDYVDVPVSKFDSINGEITVSFWHYGDPTYQPENSYVFEAADSDNNRVLNAHVPWSNSRVYWDAGNNGSTFDRIDRPVTLNEIAGQWNHWAFTKSVSTAGKMTIYLNGVQKGFVYGKTLTMNDIVRFIIGGKKSGESSFHGYLDDFSIYNSALSLSEISQILYQKIPNNHTNLIYGFSMNEGNGTILNDEALNPINGLLKGFSSDWKLHRGNEKYKNFKPLSLRPNITFVQGNYVTTITDLFSYDTLTNIKHRAIQFDTLGTDLIVVDTQFYNYATFEYMFDINGNKIDSFLITAEGTLNIFDLPYYTKAPMSYEIMSFVTPYGIRLDLGMGGKTWQFDVTDFSPVLRNNKRIYLSRGGEYQEDMDIRFLFIKGIPPRNILSIKQIWPVSHEHFNTITANNRYEPRIVPLNSSAYFYKVRSAITGHGQEGEFIARNHQLNINGGPIEYTWQVWKTCGDNPVYPQGGTWVFDRAGWCPGMATDVKEFDITTYVSGNQAELDYSVQTATGDSRYIANFQLVEYGPINHSIDASIEEIISPSNRVEFARFNPICDDAVISIQNKGGTPLTSLIIHYGLKNGVQKIFNWSGNLQFLDKEEIVLPVDSIDFWNNAQANATFEVTISSPNGTTDQNTKNNQLKSTFELPESHIGGEFHLFLKTNNRAYENSYTIKDAHGNVIVNRSGFFNGWFDDQILTLPVGCYNLYFNDTGGDGIDFWYWAAAGVNVGTGYLHFQDSLSNNLKVFEPDFGNFINYNFVVRTSPITGTNDLKYKLINTYPSPFNNTLNIELSGYENQTLTIEILDILGHLIHKETTKINRIHTNKTIDVSSLNTGIYILKISDGFSVRVKKIIKE